eukprot:GFUD01032079.1.p1 GENE.GFUD01032079.1~~GFUD01032079.1.p1  ORF type:complete len:287 (+),score=76.99 GFUD01032079.1:235-1095(+)
MPEAHSGQNGEKSEEEKQKWLEQNQYTRNGILRYEAIFGRTFVSVGGEVTTTEFVAKLDLKPGMKVLDIGCGIGGSAFLMARKYGVDVHGLDLCTNMVGIAQDYRMEMEPDVKHRVNFYVEDATVMEYPKDFFDVVYSRDAIMHIPGKEALYRKLVHTLKPRGKLMVSSYCRGDKEHPQMFIDYVKQRNYQLWTLKEYRDMLNKVGFNNVAVIDKTPMMMDMMKAELDKFEKIKDTFVNEFTPEDFEDIHQGWRDKIDFYCKDGDQVWGLITATKGAKDSSTISTQ